jgi:hypothetical protein
MSLVLPHIEMRIALWIEASPPRESRVGAR